MPDFLFLLAKCPLLQGSPNTSRSSAIEEWKLEGDTFCYYSSCVNRCICLWGAARILQHAVISANDVFHAGTVHRTERRRLLH